MSASAVPSCGSGSGRRCALLATAAQRRPGCISPSVKWILRPGISTCGGHLGQQEQVRSQGPDHPVVTRRPPAFEVPRRDPHVGSLAHDHGAIAGISPFGVALPWPSLALDDFCGPRRQLDRSVVVIAAVGDPFRIRASAPSTFPMARSTATRSRVAISSYGDAARRRSTRSRQGRGRRRPARGS